MANVVGNAGRIILERTYSCIDIITWRQYAVLLLFSQTSTLSRPLSRSLWSAPVPLGWFINAAATATEGADWPHQRCSAWSSSAGQSTVSPVISRPEKWDYVVDVNNTVQPPAASAAKNWSLAIKFRPCPCTLNQVLIDFGRFQPTTDCNIHSNDSSGTCWTNQGAKGCFQSVHVSYVWSLMALALGLWLMKEITRVQYTRASLWERYPVAATECANTTEYSGRVEVF